MAILLALILAACTAPGPKPRGADEPDPAPDSADEAEDAGDLSPDTVPPAPDGPDPDPVEVLAAPVYDHLPVLRLDTGGQDLNNSAKIAATLDIVREHDGTLSDLGALFEDAPLAFHGAVGIEIHGSSSQGFPKQSYRFEVWDGAGGDVEVPLLDMPAGTDWVLYAPYTDKTLVRDTLAYSLGAALAADTGEWQPRFAFTELVLNGEYRGVYVLIERIDRDGDRVAVPAVAASGAAGDLTGGYIVKVEQHRDEGWTTAAGTPIDYVYPRYESLTGEQDAYLRGYFASFEAMLQGGGFADPSSGYPAWIDVESWIDFYLLNELSHNVDGYRLSSYLYKDADSGPDGGLLHAGPLWDFNLAFGNADYCNCGLTTGFVYDDLLACGGEGQIPFWWQRLQDDPAYTEQLRCRWEELREGALSDGALLAAVDALVAPLAEAEPRDHARWPTIGVYVWPNYYIGSTYAEEVGYLRSWLLARAAWLDGALPGACGG